MPIIFIFCSCKFFVNIKMSNEYQKPRQLEQYIKSQQLQPDQVQIMIKNSSDIITLDQFAQKFHKQKIMEWNQATIQFAALYPILKKYQNFYEENHQDYVQGPNQFITFFPLNRQQKIKLMKVDKAIKKFADIGYQKYKRFLDYRTCRNQYHWEQLCSIMNQLSARQIRTYQYCLKRQYLKDILKSIYSQVTCLKLFIKVNEQCYNYIEQFRSKYIRPFLTEEQRLSKYSNISVKRKYQQIYDRQKQQEMLNILEQSCKQIYGQLSYMNEQKKKTLESLSSIHRQKAAHNQDYFLIGLFLGVGIVAILMMVGILLQNLVDVHSDKDKIQSMIYIFPIFRGVGLFILYIWGNAWNVYGFIWNRINYQLVLNYGSHYSTYEQIIKRAGFFTLIFIIMLLLYFIGVQERPKYQKYLPVEYTPFIVWIVVLGYIFFPHQDVFNSKGRKYFYRLLNSIIFSPFYQNTFLISWATDQAGSLVIPIKDMAYSICFYTSDFSVKQVQQCFKITNLSGVFIIYVVALIPIILRMIQCYKQAKQDNDRFIGHLQMWNFFKYLSSFVAITVSFFNSFYADLFQEFVICSIISTLYSYIWTQQFSMLRQKYDWGFLQNHSKNIFLRKHLSYKKKRYYYIAICLNLLFRCSWTITISPSIAKIIPKSTILPFVTGTLQIFRRCMWNFFRIQKEHLENCQNYKVTNGKNKFMIDAEDILEKIKGKNQNFVKQCQENLMASLIDADSFFYAQPAARKLFNRGYSEKILAEEDIKAKRENFEKKVAEQQSYWSMFKQTEYFVRI